MNIRPALHFALRAMRKSCKDCGLCLKPCAFLQRYGTPQALAAAYDPDTSHWHRIPFECSLCRLCTAICPKDLDPAAMFLEMRRQAVDRNEVDFGRYRRLLGYERRGTSPRYSWRALPPGCDTVLFPGCALPGTRPKTTQRLFLHLQQTIPALGMVLDCCAKPSHDLGRATIFDTLFSELHSFLTLHGVTRVLTACPNCYRIFSEYGKQLSPTSIYELLALDEASRSNSGTGTVGVHDPCGQRFNTSARSAVRTLIARSGLGIEELPHHGETALCCGEGGTVSCANPELAASWSRQMAEESRSTPVITSCAGCVNYLRPRMTTHHVLDLFFSPQATLSGKAQLVKPPLTYLHRLLLKRWLKKQLPDGVGMERGRWA